MVNALHASHLRELVADDADLLGARDAIADAVVVERTLEGLGLIRADLGSALETGDRPIEDDGVQHAYGQPRSSCVNTNLDFDGSIIAPLFVRLRQVVSSFSPHGSSTRLSRTKSLVGFL